jgi:hypothetical protein
MIFLKINDKELNELTLDEMADFFMGHIFFKFMDSGRAGLREGVVDLVDNICQRSLDRTKNKTARAERSAYLNPEFCKQAVNEYLLDVTNEFVNRGTSGIRRSVVVALVDSRFYRSSNA